MAHLVYQTAFIGDLLLTTPLIRGLRELYPQDKIILACRKGAGELFLHLGLVDEVFEINKAVPSELKAFEHNLKKNSYQNIICAHQSFRTHKLMLSLRAERKIGYRNWWNSLVLDDRVERPLHLPEALRLLALLKPLSEKFTEKFNQAIADGRQNNLKQQTSLKSWPTEIPYFSSLRVAISAAEHLAKSKEVLARFQIQQPAIFVAPGSVWATKKWSEEHFAELCRRLLAQGFKVYLTGSPSEQAVCDRIAQVPGVKNLAGQTSILDLFYLYAQAEYLIANDSSPIHLGAMSGAPTIAIFGPTTLSLGYRPWSDKARVAQLSLKCRPCGAHGHNQCPIGTHDCMKLLGPEQVLQLL